MSKLFKRITVLTLAVLMGFALSACGPDEPEECPEGQEYNDKEVCVDIVIPDTTAPVLSGLTEVAFTIGDDAPDYGYGITANDETDGDLTSSIAVDASAVDLNVEGTYAVTVTVTDTAGNTATETFNVVVSPIVYTPEELIAMDLAEISFDEVGDKLILPSFTANGTILYWESDNQHVITNRGFIIPPHVGSGPVTVTLTLDAINGGIRVRELYEIVVNPWDEVAVTSKKLVDFTSTSEEWTVPDSTGIELFFVDNGSVPYIDVEEFLDMLDGVVDSVELNYTPVGDDVLEVSYDYEYEEIDGTMVSGTDTAVINFTDNTVSIDALNFFNLPSVTTESSGDFNDGLLYTDVEYRDATSVVIPLGDYNFDIVVYDDNGETEYLLPLVVINQLFLSELYYNTYYNGDEIYGFDTYHVYGMGDNLPDWLDMQTGPFNDQDMPEDVRWATYNFLALSFDFFYGLRVDHGVETYYDVLDANAQTLLTGSDSYVSDYIFDFIYARDELHSSHHLTSMYLENPGESGVSLSDLGPNSTAWYEAIWALDAAIEAKYGSEANRPFHEMLDDDKTVVIHFDDFDLETLDATIALLDTLPAATENVVIDLSRNTGGISTVAYRLIGMMTDDPFVSSSQNPSDGEAYTLTMDTEYAAYPYNWYIISSPMSFSAANSTVAMAIANECAVVMGQRTGGGASSIQVTVSPDGSVYIYSSNDVESIRVGNEVEGYEYLSVEFGVDPHYFMSNVISDTQILSIIAQHQSSQE